MNYNTLHSDSGGPSSKRMRVDEPLDFSDKTVDELLQMALTVKPNLRWNKDGEWCRYCGARGSFRFGASPWGPKTFCQQHHELWSNNALGRNIDGKDEPKDPDHAINQEECTEQTFLIELLSSNPVAFIDGKRRSTRRMKKERVQYGDRESVSDSGDESTESHSISSESHSDDSNDSDIDKPATLRGRGRRISGDPADDDAAIRDCFTVSANCKLCGVHFTDYNEYRRHLMKHWDEDPNKQWTVCNEPGCDSTKTLNNYIAHLAGKHGMCSFQ